MNPLFCRAGSKRDMIKVIEKYEPKGYDKYVEPFVGGGAVYWSKADLEIPKVINDLDKKLIKGYRLTKNGTITNAEKYDTDSIELQKRYYRNPTPDDTGQLVSIVLETCNTFGSKGMNAPLYKNSNPYHKLRKIDKYKEAMKDTKILNEDYKQVIRENDGVNTFFFIDPPYIESSTGMYKDKDLDPVELESILSNIKGKFMLTMDNTAIIRNLFKKHRQIHHLVKAKGSKQIGAKDRVDLIIMNY